VSDRPDPPESAGEALARARAHARAALAEALAALRALLDAAALGATGVPAADHRGLSGAARLLEGLAADLDARGGGSASLLASVAEALDAEIARWEARAEDDPDARAVLRAFLGLRELLWEFGMRPRARARPRRSEAAPARPRPTRAGAEG
jgi:hypothetical protein